MDANKQLEKIRKHVVKAIDNFHTLRNEIEVRADLFALALYVEQLDTHIVGGGALPEVWEPLAQGVRNSAFEEAAERIMKLREEQGIGLDASFFAREVRALAGGRKAKASK